MADEILDARQVALADLLDLAPVVSDGGVGQVLAQAVERADSPAAWLDRQLVLTARRIADIDASMVTGAAPQVRAQLSSAGPRASGGSLSDDLRHLAPVIEHGAISVVELEAAVSSKHAGPELENLLAGLDAAGLSSRIGLSVSVPIADRPAGTVLLLLEQIAKVFASAARPISVTLPLLGAGAVDTPTPVELAGSLLACAAADLTVRVGPGVDGLLPVSGGHGVLNILAAACLAVRARPLEELRLALTATGEEIRLGSGALVIGDAVVESDLIVECRQRLLKSVAVDRLEDVLTVMHARGIADPEGSLA